MLSRSYKDWWEWVALERTKLVGGYLRVLYQLAGAAQEPPRSHPKAQAVYFDDFGWVRLPPDWVVTDLQTITLWVLPRGQDGPPSHPVTFPILPTGPQLGHELVEGVVCAQLPSRLPEPPFAGMVHVEFRVEGRRLWSRSLKAEVGWTWTP